MAGRGCPPDQSKEPCSKKLVSCMALGGTSALANPVNSRGVALDHFGRDDDARTTNDTCLPSGRRPARGEDLAAQALGCNAVWNGLRESPANGRRMPKGEAVTPARVSSGLKSFSETSRPATLIALRIVR